MHLARPKNCLAVSQFLRFTLKVKTASVAYMFFNILDQDPNYLNKYEVFTSFLKTTTGSVFQQFLKTAARPQKGEAESHSRQPVNNL